MFIRYRSLSIALLALFSLSACYGMVLKNEYRIQTTAPEEHIPDNDSGVVYFLRYDSPNSSNFVTLVWEGESPVGAIAPGTYFAINASKGTHNYFIHANSRTYVTVVVEPGNIYYVMCDIAAPAIRMGIPVMSTVKPSIAKSLIPKLKYISLTESGRNARLRIPSRPKAEEPRSSLGIPVRRSD